MKKITLALALSIASSAALANSGSINFHGQVHAGTCPIQIIDPSTGLPMSRINMGNVSVANFTAVGSEAASRPFSMRVTPGSGCVVNNGTGSVTFTGAYGGVGSNSSLYALQPGGATGLALIIKDDTGAAVANGAASKNYALDDTKPTDMLFSAAYQSIAASVTAGQANTDVQFLVTIP